MGRGLPKLDVAVRLETDEPPSEGDATDVDRTCERPCGVTAGPSGADEFARPCYGQVVPPLESTAVPSPLPQTRNMPAVFVEYL